MSRDGDDGRDAAEPAPQAVRVTTRGPLRWLLLTVGTLSVGLGVAGIVLPLVPTTPLLLLAAWCYARSSERFYRRLLAHPWLGPYIRNYRDGRGMTARAKATTLAVLWIAIGATSLWVVPIPWVRWLLLTIAAGVSLYLLRLPTASAVAAGATAPDGET